MLQVALVASFLGKDGGHKFTVGVWGRQFGPSGWIETGGSAEKKVRHRAEYYILSLKWRGRTDIL